MASDFRMKDSTIKSTAIRLDFLTLVPLEICEILSYLSE